MQRIPYALTLVTALGCLPTSAFAQSSWCSGANCSNGGVPVRNSVFTQELADQCADTKNFNCRTLVAPPKPQRRRQ